MGTVYTLAKKYCRRYPKGITWWRVKRHSKIVEMHLNPGEQVIYAFVGQKSFTPTDILATCVVALTNKRILIGQKRVLFGYSLSSITPDMYNDLQVYQGMFFGKITIDTIKEEVELRFIDKRALPEIETSISEYMIEAKKEYPKVEHI